VNDTFVDVCNVHLIGISLCLVMSLVARRHTSFFRILQRQFSHYAAEKKIDNHTGDNDGLEIHTPRFKGSCQCCCKSQLESRWKKVAY